MSFEAEHTIHILRETAEELEAQARALRVQAEMLHADLYKTTAGKCDTTTEVEITSAGLRRDLPEPCEFAHKPAS